MGMQVQVQGVQQIRVAMDQVRETSQPIATALHVCISGAE
jgi:hypothetical protein